MALYENHLVLRVVADGYKFIVYLNSNLERNKSNYRLYRGEIVITYNLDFNPLKFKIIFDDSFNYELDRQFVILSIKKAFNHYLAGLEEI